MFWFTLIATVAGLLTLVLGYRRNDRNVLVVAAVLLLASGAANDVVRGFTSVPIGPMAGTAAGSQGT